MKHQFVIILFLLSIIPKFICAQILTYETEYDLGNDGRIEKLLFYDKFDGEFEKTEFTNFIVRNETGTYSFENNNVWVVNPNLINYVDRVIDNRIGIIECNDRLYLMITGFQYGCCMNYTTILEWTGTSLNKYFHQEFEVIGSPVINGKRYLVGNIASSECYGNIDSDFYFFSFPPTEYRLFSDSLKVDKKLTQEKNSIYPKVEKEIDVYSATLVKVNITDETLMISSKLEKSLKDREFGIISLVKLPTKYFEKFENKKLRIMRNELFAYKGYEFNSSDLKEYFETKQWYIPTRKTSEEISSELTEIESYNIKQIKELEKKRLVTKAHMQ
ncbi:MAG: YARHG domain-containing protein [Bacteroidota bacterium]